MQLFHRSILICREIKYARLLVNWNVVWERAKGGKSTYKEPKEVEASSASDFSSWERVSWRSRSRGRLICSSSSLRRGWSPFDVNEWDWARPSSNSRTRFASTEIFSCSASVLASTNLTEQTSTSSTWLKSISPTYYPCPLWASLGFDLNLNTIKWYNEVHTIWTNGSTSLFNTVATIDHRGKHIEAHWTRCQAQ